MSRHSIKSFSAALFEKSFYLAFINIFIYFKSPLKTLIRYVFELGNYPKNFFVRTPLGLQCMTAFSHHDLITIIECFGKLDYKAPKSFSVVVDFGSNIGISALYFLTRNEGVKVYLFEPVPRNVERLKQNLKGFEDRYELRECAIGVEDGCLDFACDSTGRYGTLLKEEGANFQELSSGKVMPVKVLAVNQTIEKIIDWHGSVDLVKIDVEGYEDKILSHLKAKVLACIKRIYAETNRSQKLKRLSSKRYGGIIRYYQIN